MPELSDPLDPSHLRDVYDAQLRTYLGALSSAVEVSRDGPLIRVAWPDDQGFVTYHHLDGVDGDELDALIARQRDVFAVRRQSVEWKLHGHDAPTDLAERLIKAGFRPEERETVVIGLAGPLAAAPFDLPAGVRLRETTSPDDFRRIAQMEATVWGRERPGFPESMEAEIAAAPEAITVVLAEPVDGGPVITAGWVRYVPDTPFATLWGGATLPQWRGRGIYKALVAHRARLAVARGREYLQVDASEDSRPILERLGFVAVTTTTPYVYTPHAVTPAG